MRIFKKTLPILAALIASAPLVASAGAWEFARIHYTDGHARAAAHPVRHQPLYQSRFLRDVEHRLSRQWRRIQQGIYSGELTRKEARRLKKQQRRIVRHQRAYLDDGRLSRRERRDIVARLDAANEKIYRLKHNGAQHGDEYSRSNYRH